LASLVALVAACDGNGGAPSDDRGGGSNEGSNGNVSTSNGSTSSGGSNRPLPDLRSISHLINTPSGNTVIEMVWTPPADATGFCYEFSPDQDAEPDEQSEGGALLDNAQSNELPDGRYWFQIRIQRAEGWSDTITVGSYLIERGASQQRADGQAVAGGVGFARLTVDVSGPSHVQFYTNLGELIVCPGDCTADFPIGGEADIQRALDLPFEEEAGWRLSGWGGACEGIDADVEIRGGHCRVAMTQDQHVTVEFEERPSVTIRQTGSGVTVRYILSYEPVDQKGGNPQAARGQIDCRLPDCGRYELTGYYDIGTVITIEVPQGWQAYLLGISGACSGNPCSFTVQSDTEVTINWESR
jgi:hypothetical protein